MCQKSKISARVRKCILGGFHLPLEKECSMVLYGSIVTLDVGSDENGLVITNFKNLSIKGNCKSFFFLKKILMIILE